jgi:flavin-dependent dehydrogenase
MDKIVYTKDIPVKYDVDVFVAGGGPAGVAAAVAASRLGASVYIAESFTAFGGAAVTMLVPAFMKFGDGENFLAAGIGSEIYEAIKEKSYP